MLRKILEKYRIKGFKKINSFSILIVPIGSGVESKTHHLTSRKAIQIVSLYTLVVILLTFGIFRLTPLKKILVHTSDGLTPEQQRLVDELNQKMYTLTEELNNLKATNQDLQNAMIRGDSAKADSLPKRNGSTQRSKKNPYGGDIYSVFKEIFQEQYASSQKIFYFTTPLIGFISRGFNPKIGHMGIDIVAKVGTPVAAAASGYVVFADYTVRDGYMIIINHSDGYVTVYKHCSALLKRARDIVTGGEIIALSGNSGKMTTGPHLHFEIWKDGKPIDPKNVLINN